MALNFDSPRLVSVIGNGQELLRIADEFGANRIALCGSVARGEDGDNSDIDFFVHDFREPESRDAGKRARSLVKEFGRVLNPIGVDILGIPGWFIGPKQEASMKRDSVDLRTLITDCRHPPEGA